MYILVLITIKFYATCGDQNILEYQGYDSEIFDEKKTVITCHLILCTHKFEYLLPDVTKWVIRTLPNIYHGPFFWK